MGLIIEHSDSESILAKAKNLSDRAKTWADLSNAIFDPASGLIALTFRGCAERRKFRKTETYGALHSLVEQKMRETGVLGGSKTQKSGRFVVRLPRSMHAALELEAAGEGTSLNQLVLAKLAVPLTSAMVQARSLRAARHKVMSRRPPKPRRSPTVTGTTSGRQRG
jgi:hypothetical protein